jgi:hypothetical protein
MEVSGHGPRYPLDRRLGGPQSRFGHSVEEKNSQPPPGIEPDHPACSLVAILTELSSLYLLQYSIPKMIFLKSVKIQQQNLL